MPKPTENVDTLRHPKAEQLYDEVAFMAARLEEARAAIGTAPLVTVYLDSNGNERSKTNPAYESYIALFNAFLRGMSALDAILEEAPPTSGAARMSLDSLRVMVNDKLKAAK